LGLQPKTTQKYIQQELDDWANFGVEGHFEAKNPWLDYHELLTDKMAKIVGAKPIEVVVMNTLTTNLHLLMVSFYRPTKIKHKICQLLPILRLIVLATLHLRLGLLSPHLAATRLVIV
jgi:kynureninase